MQFGGIQITAVAMIAAMAFIEEVDAEQKNSSVSGAAVGEVCRYFNMTSGETEVTLQLFADRSFCCTLSFNSGKTDAPLLWST